jgi:inorganic pyrophosphatase
MNAKQYLNKILTVKMDRPLGTRHPKWDYVYETNYGFIPNTISGDGEELDAYVLGVDKPVNEFTGRCVAIIHRTDDDDDKLIVVPDGLVLSDEDIERATAFQEKWFRHVIVRNAPLIFLAGGGGYEDSAELDKYFFENIPENGKILYLPFARDTYDDSWVTGLVRQFSDSAQVIMPMADEASALDLTKFDAIFIGGGNTYKLLDFIITHNLTDKLKDYIRGGHGSIYGGSAGAIVMGKSIDTARKMDDATGYNFTKGLDLLNGANVACHWPRCKDYIRKLACDDGDKIYCLAENAGMIFNNDGELLITVGQNTETL